MKISVSEYAQLTKKASPNSKSPQNCLWAFLVGGLICSVGQALTECYTALGAGEKEAATAVTISLVFLSVLLTALGVYDDIARRAGAGSLVPITGFANAVSSPALEFQTEGYVLGTAAKMFLIAGPVIVYGTAASMLYGVIYWLCTR